MTLLYPDVSNNNWGDEDLTDAGTKNLYNFLLQLKCQGFAGVCHKMSQGSSYIDPYGALCQTWCKQNDFPFWGYHWVTMDAPSAQAANWIAAGGNGSTMFDFEDVDNDENATLNFSQLWAVVNAFNANTVNVQGLYLPDWYWGDIGSPDLSTLTSNSIFLVSSAYSNGYTSGYASDLYAESGGDTGEGWTSYGGATPIAWQFTSSAIISSIGSVDCNAYQGTNINQLFGVAA